MEIKTMKTVLAVVVLFLGLVGSGCGSNSTGNTGGNPSTGGVNATGGLGGTGGLTGTGGTLDANAFGQQYKFSATDIAGWQLDPTDSAAFQPFDASGLIQIIDGAAGAYTDRGCRVGVYQSLVGPDPAAEIATVWAMDFVTEAQATTMFTWKKQDQSAAIAIPPYDGTVAIGRSTVTGLSLFAHFKASYFEVQLSGYGEQKLTCSACPVAQQFLDLLKSKTH